MQATSTLLNAAAGGAPAPLSMLSFELVFLIALVSATATWASIWFLNRRGLSEAAARAAMSGFLSDGSVFLFSGRQLMAASEEAMVLLKETEGEGDALEKLRSRLGLETEGETSPIDDLIANGVRFTREIQREDGRFWEVEGRPRGSLAAIYVRDTSKVRAELDEAQDILSHVCGDRDKLVEVLDTAPIAAWRRRETGELLWANQHVDQLRSDTDKPALPAGFLEFEPDQGPEVSRRVALKQNVGGELTESWFDVGEHLSKDGEIVGVARDISDLVKVETALHRFVSTLTETFAHLPTGLAIFDADRRLNIFNPALAEQMKLDPAWLAARPGFRDFMLKLREFQMMPEEKNSDVWRERVQAIEAEAVTGNLMEKWVLPSGQTFQITGRPHPYGAVAFLFEDISTHITLEQKYRSEIALSQVTLDHLSETVCVFDTAGTMVFCNAAFGEVWGFDPMETVAAPSVRDVTGQMSAACEPSPVWGDLRDFATSAEQRTSWNAEVELKEGMKLFGVFAPLPDGSTLVVFNPLVGAEETDLAQRQMISEMRRSHRAEMAMMELALEHMREALGSLTTNIKTLSASQEESAAAAIIPEDVEHTVEYADTLLKLRQRGTREKIKEHDGLSADLSELVGQSGGTLSLSCEKVIDAGRLTSDVRRLLVNLVLVARSLITKDAHIDVTVAEMAEGVSAACMFKHAEAKATGFDGAAGLSLRILERFVAEHGGQMEISRLEDGGFTKIACTLKTASVPQDITQKLGA